MVLKMIEPQTLKILLRRMLPRSMIALSHLVT